MLGKTNAGAGGTKVFVEEEKFKGKRVDLSPIEMGALIDLDDSQIEAIPTPADSGFVSESVVLNNELHTFHYNYFTNINRHYKWDGNEWIEVSILPSSFEYSSAVVFNNEIHVLGGGSSSSGSKKHYKWDGTQWSEVSTLPINLGNGGAIVFNNELYIIGNGSGGFHKWDGNNWTQVATINLSSPTLFILDEELYAIAANSSTLYKWDGNKFVGNNDFPITATGRNLTIGFNGGIHQVVYTSGTAVYTGYFVTRRIFGRERVSSFSPEYLRKLIILNNELYMIGQSGIGKYTKTNSYTGFYMNKSAKFMAFNNEIHVFGYGDSSVQSLIFRHYKWDGIQWSEVSTLPIKAGSSYDIIDFNNEIHMMGSYEIRKHYKWDGNNWTELETLPFTSNISVVFNNEIHSFNYKKHYKWDGNNWTELNEIPFGTEIKSAVVFNNEIHVMIKNNTYPYFRHYKWNGNTWELLYEFAGFSDNNAFKLIVLNNELKVTGCSIYYTSSGSSTNWYLGSPIFRWNGIKWIHENISNGRYMGSAGNFVVLKNKAYLLNSDGFKIMFENAYSAEFTK